MSHPLVQLLFFVGLGIFVIQIARLTYSRPDINRQRWFSQLPESKWSLAFLRGFAAVWLFGGFVMICHGLTALPFMSNYRGTKLVIVIAAVAIAGTALILSTTPRRDLRTR
jgi:hypothetical protein